MSEQGRPERESLPRGGKARSARGAPASLRLPSGGLVDRTRTLSFTFNGRRYSGHAGDTLASALLANGVHLVGRSFKYHRPRGIFGAGFEETGAIVQLVGDEDAPNALATRVPLRAGLEARSVNCWPGPRFDLGAAAQAASRLLAAGFYYKTFMWPTWRLFEPLIRKAGGLGHAPTMAGSPGRYESRFGHCDVLVAGGGAAGLMAALSAARSGARTWLVDDGLTPGGRLTADNRTLDGGPASRWIAGTLAELRAMPHVRVFEDATVWGYLEHNYLAMVERAPGVTGLAQRNWKIRVRQVVIAAGAFERPIPFANGDRPGVMLASAARTYVNRYAVKPGTRAVVFTNNDSAYDAAADLVRSGIAVTLVDSRPSSDAARRLDGLGIERITDAVVEEAHGRGRVHAVTVAARGAGRRVARCDLVCVSGGWNPAIHLASQSLETRAIWNEPLATFVAATQSRRFRLAGAARGIFDLAGCLADGAAAGIAAARGAGFAGEAPAPPRADDEAGSAIAPLWFVPAPARGKKVFVDLVSDVAVSDLELALREGYEDIEHVKRYTTAGMGVDQGKTVNVNVIGAVAAMRGLKPGEIGTTTFRQPYVPVEFGPIAGHRAAARLTPMRRSPMYHWHVAAGARMYEAGLRWQRPGFYPMPGEDMAAATRRESRAVRQKVGVYDGSPLGKFLLKGPDAVRLLDLVYPNSWSNLKPGNGRYGVMLFEDGLIMDDGVTFCLAPETYLLHSSTGAADRVYAHLEELLQVHHPDWGVNVFPVTSQWANVTVCGPLTREVIRAAGTDIDVSRDAFPFMSLREGRVGAIPVRAARVSWTGELSIELNTPARHGLALWEKILTAGAPFGVTPVGSEASHLLRVEAGYISTGHEADGTADIHDLGLGWMVSKDKPDFIGKRGMELRRAREGVRREMVGLLPADAGRLIPEGAPITPGGKRTDSEGFVSACVMSVIHERSVALGLLANGRARRGETVYARVPGEAIPMQVVEPVFHDKDRSRVKG